MKVSALKASLGSYPDDADVCLDVDDGVKGSYKDILRVRLITPPFGEPFVAIDADFTEPRRGTMVTAASI